MSEGKPSIHNRRVGVREEGIYGQTFNHVFFQRYGYRISGYGTIGEHSPLGTSEFTHHDFIVKGDLQQVTEYYIAVLGLKPENDSVVDGEWQGGPRQVFQMEPGEGHWYRGFVSPNNICGKMELFSSLDPSHVRDRSDRQQIGEKGITLHSFFTRQLDDVFSRAKGYGLQHDFRVTVPREATGDRNSNAHEASLHDLNARYVDVLSLDQTHKLFSTNRNQ